ncbi:hypothetical protein GLOIN_2v1778181 [Rhizophagus irregularis DAOM 181602=DAOM 197198]|nr:hypothetical protein GLOIN_2v1778181 [Rhizophagus irregularis DAOM 181602=DAOM 197198]
MLYAVILWHRPINYGQHLYIYLLTTAISASELDLKKMNELWKPGRETKLNDQDSKKRTNYGQGPDPNQIRIRFKSDSNGSEPDSDQIEPDLIGFRSDQIY